MKKLTSLCLGAALATSVFVGCNSDYTPAENTSSSVVVYSFSLAQNDDVLANLDTVFFSVDLVNARIFNADSLPYGTRTDSLVPVIQMLETVSKAVLTVPQADGTTKEIDYISNSQETVDFSRGAVLLDVASPTGDVQRTYTINVNVHTCKADSLVWSEAARRSLPTDLAAPVAQGTAQMADGRLVCLTTDGTDWRAASTSTPFDPASWQIATATLPAGARAETLRASDGDDLYILDGSGVLNVSADGGLTWTATSTSMDEIYGFYDGNMLGARRNGDAWTGVSTSGATFDIPAGMPVSGTSLPMLFRFPLADTDQLVMLGGRTAAGTLVRDAWAFDGTSWAAISFQPLPKGLEGMALVPFFAYKISTTFVATEYSLLMAMGGTDGSNLNRTVYVSTDCGMSWDEASTLMQMPEYVPSFTGAMAFVDEDTLTAMPRAIKPITEWECPYIYTFGGTGADGKLLNTLWRSTINRMTFKPIQ